MTLTVQLLKRSSASSPSMRMLSLMASVVTMLCAAEPLLLNLPSARMTTTRLLSWQTVLSRLMTKERISSWPLSVRTVLRSSTASRCTSSALETNDLESEFDTLGNRTCLLLNLQHIRA